MNCASANNTRALLALFLSLVPGLSHLFLRQYKKAAVLLLISAGIFLTFFFSRSLVMKLLMVLIYLASAGPAAVETMQTARWGRPVSYTDRRWYVCLMLLTTGFSALPLLWQSPVFSKRAKIAWTIAVPTLAVLFFTVLAKYWDNLESLLRRFIT